MVNSRVKGCRGELEFSHFLKAHGIEARRGQQYSGNPDAPDVVSDDGMYWEVKRTQNLNIFNTMEKAVIDADGSGKTPAIAWRKNGKEWMVILRAKDFLNRRES